jgi:hypothetical protein
VVGNDLIQVDFVEELARVSPVWTCEDQDLVAGRWVVSSESSYVEISIGAKDNTFGRVKITVAGVLPGKHGRRT